MIVNLTIVALLALAAYRGTRRGFLLIGFEVLSFVVATTAAIVVYRPLGTWLHDRGSVTTGLANLAAFMISWMLAELVVALNIRWLILPYWHWRMPIRWVRQAGGAILNTAKMLIIIIFSLLLFTSLPLARVLKESVTNPLLARTLLSVGSRWQGVVAASLGRDLNDTLTFFTVSAEPSSTEHLALGFTDTDVSVDAPDEVAMLKLVNQQRAVVHLPDLLENAKAQIVARNYAKHMLALGYFSHIDELGHTPFDRLHAGNVAFGAAGENLALAATMNLAFQGLMNSPGHRENILSPTFRTVGIGIIDAGPYGVMVVQDFTD